MTWHRAAVELLGPHGSWCLCILLVVQGISQNLFAIDWAMRVVDGLAREVVQKANPTNQGPLSSVSTRNTLCDSAVAHALYCQLDAHAQIGLASFLNKIRQT
jgi:hypothetical protein